MNTVMSFMIFDERQCRCFINGYNYFVYFMQSQCRFSLQYLTQVSHVLVTEAHSSSVPLFEQNPSFTYTRGTNCWQDKRDQAQASSDNIYLGRNCICESHTSSCFGWKLGSSHPPHACSCTPVIVFVQWVRRFLSSLALGKHPCAHVLGRIVTTVKTEAGL